MISRLKDTYGTFGTGPLSEQDVARYLHYAALVHELGLDLQSGIPLENLKDCQILINAFPASHPQVLLPSLQSLHIYRKGRHEPVRLPPFLAPFPSLKCLNFIENNRVEDIIQLYGSNHFEDRVPTPFHLTKLCLHETRGWFRNELSFLIRNSPSLTHLLLPRSELRDWLADEVQHAQLPLVALQFSRCMPSALSKLLDCVAPSLEWLKITGSVDGDNEFALQTKEFPVLKELYLTQYHAVEPLRTFLTFRAPSLVILGFNIDQYPYDSNVIPDALEALHGAAKLYPAFCDKINSLQLTINSHMFRYQDGVSWGNQVIQLFPNLRNLTLNPNGGYTTIKAETPICHPNLRHLRLCEPASDMDYASLLGLHGVLRGMVPKLETVTIPEKAPLLTGVANLDVKFLVWDNHLVGRFHFLSLSRFI